MQIESYIVISNMADDPRIKLWVILSEIDVRKVQYTSKPKCEGFLKFFASWIEH